ncbi:unnamed protein product [Arabidopsis arenosa]|uniref:HECT-type E3 ubiquitin transferase n=1 Tax=Arabidopsis arenosa TaxID=38785 RepID=A0A8S1ZKI0_ARAAE|nr:unnamed protein product [Arabidopsis arenosa]
MAVAEEVTVFAETNLGTRIVMTVPLDITAADFKRKLEKTHASCFSNVGEIQVHGLMVKRKSRFYYLVESVPIKYIFGDNQKPWFIHAEARVVSRSQEPSISNSIDKTHIRHCSGSDNSIEGVTALIQGRNPVDPISEMICKKVTVAANNIRMQERLIFLRHYHHLLSELRRRRASEVPSKIKSFINSVTSVPLELIQEPLACFRWEFDKDAVLQVLRVIRLVLENCTNKHFYSSYEQHLSLLLASTDADVVEACLQTLAAFLKRQIGKYSIRDASLNSKLFSLAQGWGGKEEGLGLTSCATENSCDQVSLRLGCTLHFEFYASDESPSELPGGYKLSMYLMSACAQRSNSAADCLTTVTSGGHRGLLSGLMQKAIDSVICNTSSGLLLLRKPCYPLLQSWFHSSSGCSALREAGLIPTLVPLIKDTDPQQLHLEIVVKSVVTAYPLELMLLIQLVNFCLLDAISDEVICSAEAITCIPQCLDALCLNNSGLQAVKDPKCLGCLPPPTKSADCAYWCCSCSYGKLTLMRRAWQFRMRRNQLRHFSSKNELFLQDCVCNVARLFEQFFRMRKYVPCLLREKGIDAVLQLFSLPLMPLSTSLGQSFSVAFKNFSPQHSAGLARIASASVISELSAADADVLKELVLLKERVMRIQAMLQQLDTQTLLSIRSSSSQSIWGGDREFCLLCVSGEALVKGFTSANRRRIDGASLSSASKTLGTALAKVFLEALNFEGYGAAGHDISLSVKCRYLGKVVDDITFLTFDTRRRVCFTAMVNSFYVHGTFKELLTTFEATSQLLWTVPFSIPASSTENEKPVSGLDVLLPIWNHPMFPIAILICLLQLPPLLHIYTLVLWIDSKIETGVTRGYKPRALPLQPDETIVGMIVEMGFSRSRAEDALRRVGANSVEMAMDWLFTNPEDPVQEDDELAQALALSLGNSSETPKLEDTEKPVDVPQEEAEPKEPPVDEVIAASGRSAKIVSYLIQQLKLVQLDFSKDTGALTMIPHILALILSEDDNTREIAAQDGIVTVAIGILTDFNLKSESETEILAPKCISALLLVLSMMLQAQRLSSEYVEGNHGGSLELSDSPQDSTAVLKDALSSDVAKGEPNQALESIFGKSTGYLTMEEGHKALLIACGLIKQRVPAMIMQAVLQLCARLTKSHDLALQFLENGGLSSLFNLPKKCFFPGYDTVASVIVRHLVEDPQTLQIAMETEIRQTLSGKRHIGRVLPRTFLTTMAPVISRDPVVFMKAVASTCQLESSGGRDFVILSKEKEKPKVSGRKCSKSHRRVPANFIQVIDQLIDIVLSFPKVKRQEDDETNLISMEVDEPTTKVKGKSKVGEPEKAELVSEKSEELARVTFILKLLSDIVLMYLHGTSVILRRDTEISQLRGSNLPDDSPENGGLIYHVIHRLLPISLEKFVGPEEWKEKLSEKASWFLVVLCSRSSEGRKRIINELSRVLSVFASLGRSSSKSVLLPDKRVLAFANLVYSILTKNSSSSNFPGCGCSPDVAKSMIDGGTIQCLTSILHVIDLDHPDAPKLVTLILKSLETLTRAANAAEQLKSEVPNEKKNTDSDERHDSHGTSTETEVDELNQNNSSLQQVTDAADNGQEQPQVPSQSEGERMDFMREEIEGDQIEMSFHVENRADDDVDDDMGDEGEDDEGDDEDADLVEDGAGVMSLGGTDVEDPEDTGLGDEYNDDMIDEDEDDFHENPEPFEGVNVDDLFALRRPLGFERRRQTGRSSFDRSGSEVHGFQHPLFSRPSQTGNAASVSASAGIDPFSDRLGGGGAPPPLTDYSVVGMDSSRRGVGDSRWTDIGHPQPSSLSASIAQLIEEHFISNLRASAPADTVVERETNTTEVQEQQQPDAAPTVGSETVLGDSNEGGQQCEERELINNNENVNNPPDATDGSLSQGQGNLASPVIRDGGESLQQHDVMQPLPLNSTPNEIDRMEVGEGDGAPIEQADREAVHLISTAQGQPDTSNMSSDGAEGNQSVQPSSLDGDNNELSSMEATQDVRNDEQVDEGSLDGRAPEVNAIDPTFLEALPEDLRAEVLASQQAQSVQPPTYEPPPVDDIDPEFLAALPPDIQTEVLAQQRAQRMVQQSQGQPVDMDNASIIATLPADLREEVLLTSSEAVLAALPSPLLAEAQMLRDRAMSHYQARSSVFGSSHRLNNRRNGLGYNRLTGMDRGVGVTIGQRAVSASADGLKVKEIEGDPLVNADALKSLIRLLRLAQRLLLNLCAHSVTRANLVQILLDMIRPEMETSPSELAITNPQRLYGCQSNVVYGRSQLLNGLPPLVFRRVLEVLTYLATNHSAVADMLFYFDSSLLSQLSSRKPSVCEGKGKEKVTHVTDSRDLEIPLVVFLKLLSRPQLLQSTSHLALVMGLLQVVVYTAASRIEGWSPSSGVPEKLENKPAGEDASSETRKDGESELVGEAELSVARRKNCAEIYNIFLQLPQSDLCNLCILLGYEGLSDKIYSLAGEVLKKLAAVDVAHRKFFTKELSELASGLSASTVRELATLSSTQKMSHSTGSMAGASILRVLQVLSSLTSPIDDSNAGTERETEQEEQNIMQRLNVALEPLWQELSQCISMTELQLDHTATTSNVNPGDHVLGISPTSSLSPGTQRLLPLIEAFFVLCEKIQTPSMLQQDANVTAGEVKESSAHGSSSKTCVDSQKKTDGSVTFSKFAEKHRRLLNSFVRQNPSLLEKSLSMMLKAPRLIDFDNKKAYFRSRIRHQHDQHISGPLRISVRRAYVLEDSYNQLRMRSPQDLKGRLNVQFQGEEGIDAGGLTREWYQLLSRVIFDKGALLFTTVGNDATFQPNPNSVYQTEHLSYFKFVGRMVAKALFDGQLLDVYFTRSFYKHILGVKVTYHDIEAVDPDYYKNLKWLLENDVSDILDLTFSMDADEEKHILYEKTEVTDYELKPGGRNIRVTEETKHEYVDLVAGHILTNAIRPQINAFLEGFNELIPRELVSIFNDKELELLISGLPEIDFDDLKANTEYTSYTAGSPVIHWFWEVVKAFSKEDMARFLQFVTGTSKVPLEGFKALQGISGPQRLQIHKAYGAPERLPSAHTCFNQLDLPEYQSKEQLQERLLLAIHEASEGFGFA